ncbi:MAG TPA: 50S ribosomal protein L24, partial [Thermoplasmata archaeon]|nr:50S ribosomal protein L24 [Thermoplasmata archaeon]
MEVSKQPRKHRRFRYSAPLHIRRKFLSAHLAEDLLIKYNRRSIPVVKGDTVRIMRGEFKDHTDKIAFVDLKKGFVEVEGVILTKADGKKVAKPIHPSNVLITKLNLTDPVRRSHLERSVTEEVKKEIEKEAEEQMRELAEEKKKAEEEEAEEAEEEEEEDQPVEEKTNGETTTEGTGKEGKNRATEKPAGGEKKTEEKPAVAKTISSKKLAKQRGEGAN